MSGLVDIAIVGGGPSGLAAAMHARKLSRSSVVLEAASGTRGTPNVIVIPDLATRALLDVGFPLEALAPGHTHPGLFRTPLGMLTDGLRDHAVASGIDVRQGVRLTANDIRATSVDAERSGIRHEVGGVQARAVIDATGGRLGAFPMQPTGETMHLLFASADEHVPDAAKGLQLGGSPHMQYMIVMNSDVSQHASMFGVFGSPAADNLDGARLNMSDHMRRGDKYAAAREAVAHATPRTIVGAVAELPAVDGVFAVGDSVRHKMPSSQAGVMAGIEDAVSAVDAIDSAIAGQRSWSAASTEYAAEALQRHADYEDGWSDRAHRLRGIGV